MENNKIDIYDLTGVMLDLDSARTILGEIGEDYFWNIDPTTPKNYELMGREDFPSFKLGNRRLVSVAGLRAWVERQATNEAI